MKPTKHLLWLATGFYLLSFVLPSVVQAQTPGALSDLAVIRDNVKSKRISSYDRTGGNGDNVGNIKDGEKRILADIKGSGVITHIWITIAPPPHQLSRNDIILRMYWDGNDYPSVESPIGPFFGQGWDESYAFSSLPLSANPLLGRAMVCYFKMPFRKGARIEIENQSGKTIQAFYYYIDYLETPVDDHLGYFNAWYNHQITEAPETGENEWGSLSPETGVNPGGERNYVILDTQGKGQYVGVNYYVNNPGPIWYGEGDDMFFIDGDKTPTLNGTGTEDFFNTSWSPKTAFCEPYFGYPRVNDTFGWMGRTHLYRFNIEDPVYFDKSLKVTIEHGHNNCLTLDLASVAYWYASAPAKLQPIPDKQGRKFMPENSVTDINRWRDAWRKAHGNGPQLWGNER